MEDSKRKIGVSGVLGLLKVIGNVTIRYGAYDFLVNVHRKYEFFMYLFWRHR